jgi:alanine racemase
MHRLGFLPKDACQAWLQLRGDKNVANLTIMSHLAEAEATSQATALAQLACFKALTDSWNASRSLANSAAVLLRSDMHFEWVRPGIMLYGISPIAEKTGLAYKLKPVMTLHSALIGTQILQPGDRVGYGGTFECPETMLIGIVAMGYGDGYPRHAKNGTPVLLNNQIVPLIGRVSMDMLAIDLRTQPQAQIGDPVVLWGKGLPIEHVAAHADTIGYELLCGITERVRRVYSNVS